MKMVCTYVRNLALGAALVLSGTAYAHETGDHHGTPSGFVELAKKLSPAVVNISTAQIIEIKAQKYEKGSPLERFNDFFGGGDENRIARSLGSGFVIDKSGYIVTNNHVIEGADAIEVAFPNGESYDAKLIGRDPSTDIALLKIETGKDMPFVSFAGPDSAQVGEWVIAIGNPLGYSSSVAAGIVSANHRNISMTNYDDFIQTDVAINKGNSGGPLFNMQGEVIGVNTAIVSPTGFSVGLSFSIPSDLASSVVSQLREFGETRRGFLGVRVQKVTPDMAKAHKLNTPHGALVRSVTKDSPAEKAGLKRGDLITSLGGVKLKDSTKLARIIAEAKIDAPLKVNYIRKRKRKSLEVVIERLEEKVRKVSKDKSALEKLVVSDSALGITVEALTEVTRKKYGLDEGVTGVRVVKVDLKSDASGKLRKNDIIIEVAQEDIADPEDFKMKIKAATEDGNLAILLVLRRGKPVFYSVKSSS
ncbi:MAG: Do family serine endopeptidase [Robiginitomaculum sp.]|nr:Do family serine endopeptidase [Robiginitomaculum sp.]